MSETHGKSGEGREVVGLFAERESFEAAVAALKDGGFAHADLSVLASHESIDAAGKPEKTWREVLTALVGELRFEGPLVASGAIVLAGGPVAATIAGIIGAAVGGVAVKEVLDEVAARPHTKDFERSLAAGGVFLWVTVDTDERERTAIDILTVHGAGNVHTYSSPDPTVA